MNKAMLKNINKKFIESLFSIFPVSLIATIILIFLKGSFYLYLGFFVGFVFLIIGMTFFNLGADMAMMEIGTQMGSYVTKKKKAWLLYLFSFLLGFIITIAEPDLTVLAGQLKDLCNPFVLQLFVAIGVGLFLFIAMFRILHHIPLKYVFLVSYAITFIIVYIASTKNGYSSIAFDAGGVTTGPITVPFIMALGLGVSSARSSEKAEDDSFGLIGLCSVGPILMVAILSLFFKGTGSSSSTSNIILTTPEFMENLFEVLLLKVKDVALALLPILIFMVIFVYFLLKSTKKNRIRMFVGVLYTYIGLVLFLAGAEVGYLPIGNYIGKTLATIHPNLLILIGCVLGFFVVMAEPAVHVLNNQVEELTSGAISKKVMLFSLAVGVSLAIGVGFARIIYDFNLLLILGIGYGICFILSFFVPQIFTSIAFDSGGVATGPLTTTFLLPMALGLCLSIYDDQSLVFSKGFGLVALVALAPILIIEILGFIFQIRQKRMVQKESVGFYEDIIEFNLPIDLKGETI